MGPNDVEKFGCLPFSGGRHPRRFKLSDSGKTSTCRQRKDERTGKPDRGKHTGATFAPREEYPFRLVAGRTAYHFHARTKTPQTLLVASS